MNTSVRRDELVVSILHTGDLSVPYDIL